MIKVAIVGASGYTGSELVRFLAFHPEVEIHMITSEQHAGKRFSDLHPAFAGICDLQLVSAEEVPNNDPDLCFLALPHRVAMDFVARWQNADFKIVDLSGDFRLSSAKVYEEWYDKKHVSPELVPQVPYGLPELHRDKIRKAQIVANPGCYPTAATLALAPLAQPGWVDPQSWIVDAKSGTTGAGIKVSKTTHFSNVSDNFKAYGLKTHRHTIEIEENLGQLYGEPVRVQFTPHLLPVDRGILATAYAKALKPFEEDELQDHYRSFFEGEPFIRIREEGPDLKQVRGTNYCDIYPTYDKRTRRILVISVIDNLVKGAAGQAIHNMNLMFDLPETTGLQVSPLQP